MFSTDVARITLEFLSNQVKKVGRDKIQRSYCGHTCLAQHHLFESVDELKQMLALFPIDLCENEYGALAWAAHRQKDDLMIAIYENSNTSEKEFVAHCSEFVAPDALEWIFENLDVSEHFLGIMFEGSLDVNTPYPPDVEKRLVRFLEVIIDHQPEEFENELRHSQYAYKAYKIKEVIALLTERGGLVFNERRFNDSLNQRDEELVFMVIRYGDFDFDTYDELKHLDDTSLRRFCRLMIPTYYAGFKDCVDGVHGLGIDD